MTCIAICLSEHPLTADKIKAKKSSDGKIQLYEEIIIDARNPTYALLDFEMVQLYLPQWLWFYGKKEDLSVIDAKINEPAKPSNYFLTQNLISKSSEFVEDEWLCFCLNYKGCWTHLTAMKTETQVFDMEYEARIKAWYGEFAKREKANTVAGKCINISNFLARKLGQSSGPSVVYAILKRQCQCTGYADSYKFLAYMEGIDCILVGNQEAKHAWVMVKVGDRWLNSDPDWEDMGTATLALYQLRTNKDYKNLRHPIYDIVF